jgi:hypothetical protein
LKAFDSQRNDRRETPATPSICCLRPQAERKRARDVADASSNAERKAGAEAFTDPDR